MLNGYSVYVFDIDGTILDTAPRILTCLKLAIEQAGLHIAPSKITQDLIGPKIADILNILGISISSEQKDEVVQKFRNLYDNDPESDTTIYPQILDVINQVRLYNLPMYIATNKPIKPTLKLLKDFNFNFFNDVYCPNKYEGKLLSKANMLEEIVSKNNVEASKVLMIGDTEGDFEAAKQVGCKFAFAPWGYEKDKNKILMLSDLILGK